MLLHINVANKIATYARRDGELVCGNNDYEIEFAFDEEWKSHEEKTARFIWNGRYTDVGFTGETCPVPLISNATALQVGVYAGDLSTTTPAFIFCKKSILCGNEPQRPESAEVYTNEAKAAADRAEEVFDKTEEILEEYIGDLDDIIGGGGTGGGGGISAEVEQRLTDLETAVADLNYKEITIGSFSASPSTAEMGSTVSSVALSWGTNKTPTALTLDGSAIAVEDTTKTVTGTFTANKTWMLKATDERDAVATKTATLSFLNGVYYGVTDVTGGFNNNQEISEFFYTTFTKTLRSSKLTSFSVNAGANQYIYYMHPTRFGKCSFKVGGFDGGFTLFDTFNFTNPSGYTEEYYIYRSDNAGLGQTSVTVS